jgi:hypothetical protein
MGGLCNQLFQILMAYTYAQRNDCIYVLDISKRMLNPHSNKNYFETIYKQLPLFSNIPFNYLVDEQGDKCLSYTNYSKTKCNTIFRGYFQTEKYFEENVKFINDIFDFNEYINKIEIDYESVFIHIRLGDYNNHQLHDVKLIEKGYYEKAIEYINKLYPNIKYKVFSNDLELCKQLLSDTIQKYNNHFEFIDENDELKSIILMSKCYKGGIGANSSYSWFANLFNRNPNKTFILPNKWFNDNRDINDMYPKNCVIINLE